MLGPGGQVANEVLQSKGEKRAHIPTRISEVRLRLGGGARSEQFASDPTRNDDGRCFQPAGGLANRVGMHRLVRSLC